MSQVSLAMHRPIIRTHSLPYRQIGKTDLRVSRLSLGTTLFGERTSFKDACLLMDEASEHGVNLFDTAEMYPIPQSPSTAGLSEKYIGKWLKKRSREDVIISCKVCGPSGQMTWIRDGPKSLDKTNIKKSVEGSLDRLSTDYIDLLHLHWPDRYVPMFGKVDYDTSFAIKYVGFEEQLEALEECIREGKVRCIGLSNETAFGVMKFSQLAKHSSYATIASLQNSYHLLCRIFDTSLAECCYEENISLLAYSPLAMGLLTGKYLNNGGPSNARLNLYKDRYAKAESRYGPKPNLHQALVSYSHLAAMHGLSLTEMSIRFVLHHPLVASAIIGATTQHQLKDNIKYASKGPLDHSILSEINKIHQKYPNPTP